MDIAVFAPGDHHGTGTPWTVADIDEVISTYNPAVHEAPSVIGHDEQRRSKDPAYGWVERLYRQGDVLWAHLKQVPAEFKAWAEAGRWKKRSAEIYTDFQGTGRKYLRAIAWLGAQPPAVKGLPDVAFAEDGGPFDMVEFAEGREGKLRQAWEALKDLFEDAAGPIEQQIGREDALMMFDRIRQIAGDELYHLVYSSDEMDPEEKRGTIRTLFDELIRLIGQNGDEMVAAFMERSQEMADKTPNPGTITLTPEQLKAQVQEAVNTALTAFEEKMAPAIKARVDEGLAAVTQQTRHNAVQIYCERLKEQGVAPAVVDGGMAVFMERLPMADTVTFAEGKDQTPAAWFEEFLGQVVAAAKANTLLVPFGEVGKTIPGPDTGDAKARALADFAENKDFYRSMGVTAEDLEKYDGILNPAAT